MGDHAFKILSLFIFVSIYLTYGCTFSFFFLLFFSFLFVCLLGVFCLEIFSFDKVTFLSCVLLLF